MVSESKEKILVAALELFSQRGYAAVGTRAIAESAGVNEVTVFRHFGSKEALWLEVFRRYVVRPEAQRILAGANGDPAHDLEGAARAIVELLRSNIKLLRMTMKDENQAPEIHAELAGHPERAIKIVEDHLNAIGASTTLGAPIVARTLVETLFGVVIHFEGWGREGHHGLNQWLDHFLPLFLRGALPD